MTKKNPPVPDWLRAKFFSPDGAPEQDYGDDAGAGFPETRPMTEADRTAMMRTAFLIRQAQALHAAMPEETRQEKAEKAKAKASFRKMEKEFAFALVMDHGIRKYTWPLASLAEQGLPHHGLPTQGLTATIVTDADDRNDGRNKWSVRFN